MHSVKGVLSVCNIGMNSLRSHHAQFTRATLDKQNKSGTNPRYSFRLRGADCLSARAGATGCSRSRDTVLHSAGRYSEIHHRINNISVKSCENQIQRRILLKLRISEQTPLMWKPGKTLFNNHNIPPFTMDLT